jgi:hypothetical protein
VVTALFLVHGVSATAVLDRQLDQREQHSLPVEARLKYFRQIVGDKGETHIEKAWKAAEAEKRALSKQEADNKQAALQNEARKVVLAKYGGLPWVSKLVGKAKPTFVGGGQIKQPMNAGGLAYKAKELAFFRKKKQDKVDKAVAAVKRQAALRKSNLAKWAKWAK